MYLIHTNSFSSRGNWPKLGLKASHGCIRMHPDNGKIFNRLVRSVGISQTWITVRN
ncbi:MAG: L,D-transpeptidase family protein [Bacteriovoracia bacterium]